MKARIFLPFLLIISFILLPTIISQAQAETKMLVRVDLVASWQFKELLSLHLDIASYKADRYVDLVLTPEELRQIENLGYSFTILVDDLDKKFQETIMSKGDLGAYHTYQEMYNELVKIQTDHPSIAKLYDIGDSYEGRQIWAMKVSDNVATEEDEPEVLYLGNHHARELITVEIPLHFLNYLTDNYSDPAVKALVDNREIWVVPMVNPDGHVKVEEGYSMWRKNTRPPDGVDLNRNYSYMWGYDNIGSSGDQYDETYRGTAPFSEYETQAIRNLVIAHQFVACFSYHSYGDLELFSWGYKYANTPDHSTFVAACESITGYNGYTYGNPASGVIYITNGDTDDYMYGEQGTKCKSVSITPEVGDDFWPPDNQIPSLCNENLGPNLFLLRMADMVIYRPIAPTIDPLGSDPDGNYTVSWTNNQGSNPGGTGGGIDRYELQELKGIHKITDNAEAGTNYWNLTGFSLSTTRYHSSSHSFYSGRGDNLRREMVTKYPTRINTGDSLIFWCWYEIEYEYDKLHIDVSSDGGNSWNELAHFTGDQKSWVRKSYSLSSYAGKDIFIRFQYLTDTYINGEGIYIDDIYPVQYFDTVTTLSNSITETHYDITGRTPGTYYYRVRAHNPVDWGYWSWTEDIEVTAGPILELSLDPDTAIVHRGGTLGYTATVTNLTGSTQTFQFWTEVVLPNGNPYPGNPVVGPRWVTLNPYQTKSGHVSHKVPNNAPLGTYTYTGKAGTYPSDVWDEDSFNFEVVP